MQWQSDLLLFGSTSESGEYFGTSSAGGGDVDGFITKLDPSNGSLVDVKRFGVDSDDLIKNICDDPNDPNSFYDFGSTWVTGGFMPSIFKIDQSTFAATWTQVL